MVSIKKILFIGLGGVGQRHLSILKKLRPNIEIYAYRQRNKNLIIQDLKLVNTDKTIKEYYGIKKEYINLDKALNANYYDLVFICNPSNMHVETAVKVANKGFNIFMEKPVNLDYDNIKLLRNIIKTTNIKVIVGFQMRFHPLIQHLKNYINNNKNNNILSVQIEHGSYMPAWHPWEDYRELYCSKKSMDGGVLLSQIHEIDYMLWIFGVSKSVYYIEGQYSSLKIETEDSVDMLFTMVNNNNEQYPLYIHLDFLQKQPSRYCKIITEKEVKIYDFIKNIVTVNGKKLLKVNITWNKIFVLQMKALIKSIENNKIQKSLVVFSEAYKSTLCISETHKIHKTHEAYKAYGELI